MVLLMVTMLQETNSNAMSNTQNVKAKNSLYHPPSHFCSLEFLYYLLFFLFILSSLSSSSFIYLINKNHFVIFFFLVIPEFEFWSRDSFPPFFDPTFFIFYFFSFLFFLHPLFFYTIMVF
jgi:hypothetical protein